MGLSSPISLCFLALLGMAGAGRAEEAWTADDFTEVSSPASPRVAYALRQDQDGVNVAVDVFPIAPKGDTSVDLGLQAARAVVLHRSDAKVSEAGGATRYAFSVPASALVSRAGDWDKLRFGFSVAWGGGPFGGDRQRERFLQAKGAPFDGLSADPADWLPYDLRENAALAANRKKRIFLDFEQPFDGKASLVIEDAAGRRVRNLVSGEPFAKGPQRVPWDGFDENGNLAAPGTYTWRALSHPGIVPHYLFAFYNPGNPPWRSASPSSAWLADHSDASAAAAWGDRVYLGCPIAEAGHNVVQLTLDGEKTAHADFSTTGGLGTLFLAADADCFYAVSEGQVAYDPPKDLPGGAWQFRRPVTLLRWDTGGRPKAYPGRPRGEKVIVENPFDGSGPKPARAPLAENLAGAALYKGSFYVSLRKENRIVVVSAADGGVTGEIKLPDPGLVATNGDDLLVAFSGKTLMRLDPAGGAPQPLFSPDLAPLPAPGDAEDPLYGFSGRNPTGMAVGPDGEVFLSDNGKDQNVKVYDLKGTLLRQIGRKGGRVAGPWDPAAMAHPHGLALDRNGRLWVAETDSFPRCNTAWDAKSGALVRELMGPGFYGAPGGTFDPEDHTRWIGGGALWKLDFQKRTATPVATLYRQTKPGQLQHRMEGYHWNFYHRDKRTFLIGFGGGSAVYELRADGSVKLWAFCGPLSAIAQSPRWTLPKAVADLPAVQALFAENAKKNNVPVELSPFGPWRDKVSLSERLLGSASLLWVDKNGDDLGQAEEFEVLPSGDSLVAGWGAQNPGLDLNLPARIGGREVLLRLQPDGFLPSGAPNYSLARAVAAAVPLEAGATFSDSELQDRFGREVFLGKANAASAPMIGAGPDGKTQWTFPNYYIGVHGSHDAPLPRRGAMQGDLFFLGGAPLDDKADVFVVNGNHGRFFAMTTDGFYLDEMFKDVRVTQETGPYLIGGESFGGCFGRGEDGAYYLQSGGTEYRLFRVDGLDKIRRAQGTVAVSAAQAAAAQALHESQTVAREEAKQYFVAEAPAAPPLPADGQWPVGAPVEWGNTALPFPFVQVRAARQGANLRLFFHVKDPSPWVNQGTDWTQLFKTGDGADFQFSCDPAAPAGRTGPVAGDKRLLIAPFQDRTIAVLYSYREAGAPSPVNFSSPSRTERIDRVVELKDAQAVVRKGDGWYEVNATVPLAELGLPAAGRAAALRGDFGVVYGDESGTLDVLRSYWANQATGLVNDLPGEAAVSPRLWGTLQFNAAPNP